MTDKQATPDNTPREYWGRDKRLLVRDSKDRDHVDVAMVGNWRDLSEAEYQTLNPGTYAGLLQDLQDRFQRWKFGEHHATVEKLIGTLCADLQSLVTSQSVRVGGGYDTEMVLSRCEALLVEARGLVSGDVDIDDVDAAHHPHACPKCEGAGMRFSKSGARIQCAACDGKGRIAPTD